MSSLQGAFDFLIGLRRDEPLERLLCCVEGYHTCRMFKRKNILRGRDKFVVCLSVFLALTKMKCLFLTYLTCVIPNADQRQICPHQRSPVFSLQCHQK